MVADVDGFDVRLADAMGCAAGALPTAKQRRELADHLGVTPQAINKIFMGAKRTRSMEAPHNLWTANFYKVNPDWLATGEGPREPTRLNSDEEQVIADLRELHRLQPDTYETITKLIGQHAHSARLANAHLTTNHGVKRYTTPARAAETLGKAVLPADAPRPPEDSSFAGLSEPGASQPIGKVKR